MRDMNYMLIGRDIQLDNDGEIDWIVWWISLDF